MLRVIAAAVLSERGLLLASTRVAPDVFSLPSGELAPGEETLGCLRRALRRELGVGVSSAVPLMDVRDDAAPEGVGMELAVLSVALDGAPEIARLDPAPPASGTLAELAWWPERTDLAVAPAVWAVVIPRLRAAGRLGGAGGTRVTAVAAGATDELRAAVLRPGLGVAAIVKPDDAAPSTAFFAVVDPEDRLLSTANVRPQPPAWDPDGGGWWQLRGMATAPEHRGRGHGASVLWAALDHVDATGGRVWCNARTPALSLYLRAGFVPVGARWEHPVNGPHQTLARPAPR